MTDSQTRQAERHETPAEAEKSRRPENLGRPPEAGRPFEGDEAKATAPDHPDAAGDHGPPE